MAAFLIWSFISSQDCAPLLHLLLHVDALFVQQLPLSKGPVHRLRGGFCTWSSLPLSSGLCRVVEAENVALPQNNAIPCNSMQVKSRKKQHPHQSYVEKT